MASLFEIPIEHLNGIGSKKGQLYRKLGIDTVGALVRFYPRTYEDWSNPCLIDNAEAGQTVCIKAFVMQPVNDNIISGGRILSKTKVYDGSDYMILTFFNNRYIRSMLKMNEEYLFYGKITQGNGFKEMVSPVFLKPTVGEAIHPIYSQVAGLTTRQIEASVKQAVAMLPEVIVDPIPDYIRYKFDLVGLKTALNKIHFPQNMDDVEKARHRLIFEELLVLVIGLTSLKSIAKKESDIVMSDDHTEEFVRLLPYTLTNAQMRAIKDCIGDMIGKNSSMNRLVQGDVGSGKTMVAAACAYTCIKEGYQAAMMAPTEILAEQHFDTFSKLFDGTEVKTELLTGSMTAKQKRIKLEKLVNGEINFIVGTHSLISDNVEFSKLGLVITDEQHRFGVRQRADLLAKGQNPHLLVMSATPIPRTLALMIYGDLDLSVIDELPPGRQAVDTMLIDDSVRLRAYNFIRKNIKEGRQCYIVCPAVENNETGLISAVDYAEELKNGTFKDLRVEVLHGKMKASAKDDVMQKFIRGEIDVLVSTTVIEVGVNVPNAVIMMIENADRFGLSQLHQLRGRVGRGEHKSYCILVSNSQGQDSRRRLKVLCQTNDGFAIADEDLKLRGPGDFFGSRQHGLPELKIADLAENVGILHDAQEAAKELIDEYNNKNNLLLRGLRAEVRMLFNNAGQQLN